MNVFISVSGECECDIGILGNFLFLVISLILFYFVRPGCASDLLSFHGNSHSRVFYFLVN